MDYLAPILIIGGLVIFILWQKKLWFFSNKTKSGFAADTVEDRVLSITTKIRGPLGTNFWIESGAVGSLESLDAYERGMTDCFRRAGCIGYTRLLNHSDYIIAILKSTENDSQGFPCYRLPAGQYAGTEWDKGGYILVAGQMVFLGTPYGNIIAIPDHILPEHMEHAATVAGFEAEHPLHGYNNGEEFERTKTHGGGFGHPTIPPCPGESLASMNLIPVEKMFLADYTGRSADR